MKRFAEKWLIVQGYDCQIGFINVFHSDKCLTPLTSGVDCYLDDLAVDRE